MNTLIWEHPLTAKHLREIEALGIRIIPPVVKTLACGDIGVGAMADVQVIFDEVKNLFTVLPKNGSRLLFDFSYKLLLLSTGVLGAVGVYYLSRKLFLSAECRQIELKD